MLAELAQNYIERPYLALRRPAEAVASLSRAEAIAAELAKSLEDVFRDAGDSDVPPTVPHFPQAPSTQNPVRQAQIPGTTCREAA